MSAFDHSGGDRPADQEGAGEGFAVLDPGVVDQDVQGPVPSSISRTARRTAFSQLLTGMVQRCRVAAVEDEFCLCRSR
ncbi:hypothetical protein ACIP2Y_44775 [Streptomyces sviceus]|uniref:hypothetical protein n=1 Tax=Streptomyces sviceus TaxID=285530 RepID=UPI003802E4DF